jgi:hypothetical protein
MAATAIATAAAAISGPLVMAQLDNRTDPAGQDKRNVAWTPWVDLPVPKGMRLNPRVHTTNRQDYELVSIDSPWLTQCLLTVHRNGDFDPATIPAGSPRVDLNGREGRIVTAPQSKPFIPAPRGYLGPLRGNELKTVTWQPGTGLWALLTCTSQLELGTRKVPKLDAPFKANVDLATTIAKSISPGTRNLGSPIKIGYLPTDLRPEYVSYRGPDGEAKGFGQDFGILLSDGDPKTGFQPRQLPDKVAKPSSAYSPRIGDDLQIRYTTGKFWDQLSRFEYRKPDLTIHGLKAWYVEDAVIGGPIAYGPNPDKLAKTAIRMEGNGVAIIVHSLGAKPRLDDLRKIAETLQLTKTPNDPNTWFDASTAIP